MPAPCREHAALGAELRRRPCPGCVVTSAWLGRARACMWCATTRGLWLPRQCMTCSAGDAGVIVTPWVGCTMHETLAGLSRRPRRLRRFAHACAAAGVTRVGCAQLFVVFVLRAGDASRGGRRHEGARAGRGRLVCRGSCTNTPFDSLLALPAAVLPGGCGLWGCLTLTCPVFPSDCRPHPAACTPGERLGRLCTFNFAGCAGSLEGALATAALCKSASPYSYRARCMACEVTTTC